MGEWYLPPHTNATAFTKKYLELPGHSGTVQHLKQAMRKRHKKQNNRGSQYW